MATAFIEFTTINGGECFVDPRTVIAVKTYAYAHATEATTICCAGPHSFDVVGFPREVHDALFRDIPMEKRAPVEPAVP